MELAFKGNIGGKAGFYELCFNPSSIGIGLQSFAFSSIVFFAAEFQSFFYWNWPSKPGQVFQVRITSPVSILLLLELAFKGKKPKSFLELLGSFNPSSIGIGLQRQTLTFQKNDRPAFQSFFYWNWPSKHLIRRYHGSILEVSILLLLELAFKVA